MKIIHSTISQKRVVLLLVILTLFAAGLGSAQAGKDWKTMPGSYCRPMDLNSPDVGYLQKGLIYNKNSTKRLTIYCPIIRDMMSVNAKWNQAVIEYQNPNATQVISCSMYVRNRVTGATMSYHHGRSGTNNTGLIRIYNSSKSGIGMYTLSCSLSARAGSKNTGIRFIHIQESD